MLAFVGDIHGNFIYFNQIMKKIAQNPNVSAVIQVGDFGMYPHTFENLRRCKFDIPVYWIDGNHEGFDIFMDYTDVQKIHKNCFYVPRGTILELDGKKIAFCGGASSVDKDIRLRYGMDWNVKENITDEQIAKFDSVDTVDIFVTHVPPQSVIQKHFDPRVLEQYFGLPRTWRDSNADKIETVWRRWGHPLNICGHMHRSVVEGNCRILGIEEVWYHS